MAMTHTCLCFNIIDKNRWLLYLQYLVQYKDLEKEFTSYDKRHKDIIERVIIVRFKTAKATLKL